VICRAALLCCIALVAAPACGPPIKVRHVEARDARRVVASNALTSGKISRRTHNLLYSQDLVERYEDDPAGALAALHASFVAGRLRPENAVAISELAFHHAEHGGGSPYYLASALYAWMFLFPDNKRDIPDDFEPRVRGACELYNRALTAGFKNGDAVDLRAGTYPLPFGTLDVALDPATLTWSDHRLYNFFPLGELEVTGFPTYYRWPGLGAPLAAGIVPDEGRDKDILARRMRVPVTAVLRLRDLPRQLREGRVRGALELYAGYGEQTIDIDGRRVPLEAEPTAALALGLSETAIWERETAGFLKGGGIIEEDTRLRSVRPYQPGLIPVVFVHGTASSAARWAQIYNELDNDPRIHDHFQFWFFSYETGNPIIYSAMLLREALTGAVKQLDPAGRDAALQRMVVIGHSQGGLLTKTTVVESGDAFYRNLSTKPIDQLRLSDASRDLLRRATSVHPLPFVRRVIFLATPHHGSYIAGSWIAHQVARLVKAPLEVTKFTTEFATLDRDALAVRKVQGAPTAVDNMTPGNRFVKTLANLPIAPGVKAHSIIPVKGDLPPQGQNDGVVEYDSAHIDGVDSELVVVRQAHSCQANPHTIEEVRRILLEHLAGAEPARLPSGPRSAGTAPVVRPSRADPR
jgi:triacylglycerol esterase/lipase EstA (alpha/beta hydrolase family)